MNQRWRTATREGRPLNTAYRRGVYREKVAAAALRKDGYFVLESRGSHGVADIVAVKQGQVLLVQVKTGDVHDSATGLASGWWNELYRAAADVGALALIADNPRHGVCRFRRLPREVPVPNLDGWPLRDWTPDEAARDAVQ
jgi:Holliday junction resolvase